MRPGRSRDRREIARRAPGRPRRQVTRRRPGRLRCGVLVPSPLRTRGVAPVRPGQRLRRADGLRRKPRCDVALTEILAAGVQVVTLSPAAGVHVVTLSPAAGIQVTLSPAPVVQALAYPAVFPPGVFPPGPVRGWHVVRPPPARWSPPGGRVSNCVCSPEDNVLVGCSWHSCGFPAGVRFSRHFQGWRVSPRFPPAGGGSAHVVPPEDLVTPGEAADDEHKQRQARHANGHVDQAQRTGHDTGG
jgi:hypothetical protein